MSWIDRLFGSRKSEVTLAEHNAPPVKTLAVAADNEKLDITHAYLNNTIGRTGCLKGYDYDAILFDKQNYENVLKLFRLSDYYTDADEIIRGIIKEAYVPFACADKWRLSGADEKIKQRYEDYYERIDLKSFMESFFLQYFKYANVYTYRMPSGRLTTLPVHYIRIANLAVNGEPVLEFKCGEIRRSMIQTYGEAALQQFIDDGTLESRLAAFPPEVAVGVEKRYEWVELNPKNTYTAQDSKEEWVKYATPFIGACQKTLAKKALISNYEDARLNLGAHGFVLATYGDPDHKVLPTSEDLNAVAQMMMNAIKTSGLAVGNNWLEAKFVESDMRDLFEFDAYKNVNAALLSAGGLSPIVVTGQAGAGSSFGMAQVNIQTAAMRIKQAKDDFARMMNKINANLNGQSSVMPYAASDRIPEFLFPPTDLAGNKAFQETCLKLWEKGMLSDRSFMETYGFDIGQEFERKKQEQAKGHDKVFVAPSDRAKEETDNSEGQVGRPTLTDTERNSDVSNSMTGRNPKPSNPEGSEPQTE